MIPRMSSSRIIRNCSPSILISVPPYLEISTRSPFFTVKSTFFPLSSTLPVPRATTLPSCGFSLAVSGMMIPPFFTSCSSSGCTSTRSPRGLTLTVAISYCYHSFGFLVAPRLRKLPEPSANVLVISSCRRQPLRTPHRQRRLRVCPRLVRHRDDRLAEVRVADRLVLTP